MGKESFYHKPFGETSGSDSSKNVVITPIAANLVRLMAQARQDVERRGSTEFYPQWWMYDKISQVVSFNSPHWRRRVQSEEFQRFAQRLGINTSNINLRSEISDEELEERQHFFRDIATAYGIAAYSQFTPRQKDQFREELREEITELNFGNVTLNEQQRELLRDITTATNTPFNPNYEEYHFATVLNKPDITEEEMQEDPRYDTW